MKTVRFGLAALIGSILLASLALGAHKTEHSGAMQKTPMADMLKGKSGADFEAVFLGMMILHHQGGVKMAQMAVEKATSPELKQMMQKAAKDQQDEIEKMTGWLNQWHNKSPGDFSEPSEMKRTMQANMSELEGLSGAAFDKKFAQHMAEHHADAIAMSKLAESKASHAEVKQLAAKIRMSQTEEQTKLMQMAEK